MTTEKDVYDDMTGPVLAEELGKRELPVTGKVDELRARLREDDARRAEKAAQGSDDTPEGEDEGQEYVEVPEPRQPLLIQPYGVKITEEQARVLNAAEARLRQFTKHVNRVSELKYAAGDQVMALGTPDGTWLRVLPHGIEIEHTPSEVDTEQNEG